MDESFVFAKYLVALQLRDELFLYFDTFAFLHYTLFHENREAKDENKKSA